MELENLLSKDGKRKYQFLRFLEEATDLSALNSTIQDRLDLSNFLFNKTIDELNTDFDAFQLNDYFSLETDAQLTRLVENGQATSDILLEHYLKESMSFQILADLFTETYTSTHEFALNHFTSYSRVYSRTLELKKMFKPLDVTVNKKYQVTGNEETIRFVYTRLFSFAFPKEYAFYDEALKQTLVQTGDVIVEQFGNMGKHLEYKLNHFLAVSMYREKLGYHLADYSENKEKVFQSLSQTFQAEYDFLSELGLPQLVTKEVFCFLYTHSCFNEAKLSDLVVGKRIERLNGRFLTEFEDRLGKLNPEPLQAVKNELTRIHFEVIYFPINLFYSYERFDVTFFEESYLEFFDFCREYLMDEAFIHKEGFEGIRPYLFYHYLMILVSQVSLEAISPEIVVCIDFSFGQQYNLFIEKNLAFFVSLNLTITNTYSDQVDVVITNLNELYASYDVKSVIWLDPPRPSDWANLANVVNDVRIEKRS